MGSELSPERPKIVEAELVPVNEGSMYTVVMRDGAAPIVLGLGTDDSS